MCLEDLPMRQRPVKSPGLRLTFASSSELEESLLEKSNAEGSTRSGHHLLELLLHVSEVVLLLIVALAVVISLGVVVLVGGVELLPLGAVSHKIGGVAALKAAPM
jgi:hypothetical protein